MIRVVLFDMDGTLVHIPVTLHEFFRMILYKLGFHYNLDEVAKAWKQVNDQLWTEKFSDFTTRTRAKFLKSNRMLLEILGVEGDTIRLAEMFQFYCDNLPEASGEQISALLNTSRPPHP